MEEVQLKNKRRSLKSQLTRICNYVNAINEQDINENILEQLSLRLNVIEPLLGQYTEIQDTIECLPESNSELEETDRLNFEEKYFNTISQIKIILKRHTVIDGSTDENV